MEFKNVFTFARVAELGSFTAAGKELGYTQSTVTIQIQQLEKELGVPLFDRIGKRITLTPMGQEFLTYANEILSITAKAKSRIADSNAHYGSLRIGILESLFVWKFCDLVPRFHSAMPFVDISLKLSTGPGLYQKLRQNEIDIAYLLNRRRFVSDCVHVSARFERIIFVTYPGNAMARTKGLSLAEVMKAPLLMTERQAEYRTELDEVAADRGIEYVPLMEVDNITGLIKLVRAGMGVSFLPECVVHNEIAAGELVELDVADCAVNLWSQVVYHRSKWVTPQMELFIKLVEEDGTPPS